MNLFKYEKTAPEILKRLPNRMEDGVVVDTKIQKVKNVGFLHIQKIDISSRIAI